MSKSYVQQSWLSAAATCHRMGMGFLEFISPHEMYEFLNLAEKLKFDRAVHVGGFASKGSNKHPWYWLDSGNEINLDLPFHMNEPNNHGGVEFCLELTPFGVEAGVHLFNDIRCHNKINQFVCTEKI